MTCILCHEIKTFANLVAKLLLFIQMIMHTSARSVQKKKLLFVRTAKQPWHTPSQSILVVMMQKDANCVIKSIHQMRLLIDSVIITHSLKFVIFLRMILKKSGICSFNFGCKSREERASKSAHLDSECSLLK